MITYLLDTIQYLASGALVSLKIFFVTLVCSLPIGIVLSMTYRLHPILQRVIAFYTWLFRGTPLMLQLFFFMYGLPAFGIPVDRMMVAYIAFIINYSAYFTEVIRAGIESLPKDQQESAAVMGANTMRIYRSIIMPQAIRIQIPVITNEVITLIKDTALVTVIALSDLMRNVKEIVSRDFTISPFFLAAIFYLLMSFLIIQAFRRIEKKYDFMN
ncbi:MAG: amino acid ABC transporter permease [Bacilli bacterium]|nr:amino acid ABC transporter permease [Bacilli bacterium]MBN2876265.1 amino acid ABC transporter permease [Bacilli bacterium]